MKETLPVVESGLLLKGIRERRLLSRAYLGERLYEMLNGSASSLNMEALRNWLFSRTRNIDAAKATANIARFEDGKIAKRIPCEAIDPLSELYRISPLTLLPYKATPKKRIVAQQLSQFRSPDLKKHSQPRLGGRYRFSIERLAECDAEAVYVEFEPRGKSESHWHVGDEIIFVLEGAVQVNLEDAGVETRDLMPGDFIHFLADQRHQVLNVAEGVSKVFVLRFHQMAAGFRARVEDAISEIDRQLTTSGSNATIREQFQNYLGIWLRGEFWSGLDDARDLSGVSPSADLRLRDAAGFASLLQVLRRNSKHTWEQIQGKAEEIGILKKDFQQLRKGRNTSTDITRSQLSELAQFLEIPDLLFFPFMFNRVPNFVTVRSSGGEKDLWSPDSAESTTVNPTTSYRLPRRCLGGTDTSIGYFDLKPNGKSVWNSHPGHELALIIQGEALVELKINGKIVARPVHGAPGSYALFDSSFEHRISNPNPEIPCKIFLVRLYDATTDFNSS